MTDQHARNGRSWASRCVLLIAGAASLAGCGTPADPSAMAALESKSASTVTGTAVFTSSGGQVTLKLTVAGATSGSHAAHIHDVGDCSAADGASAGGHWNPTTSAHGMFGGTAHHLGDLGNMVVTPDGMGTLSLTTDKWSIGTGMTNDVVGHAIIIHGGVDDYTTQPTGNAGNRQACGKINLSQ
jgi:Cu-Zn family superoxide dismutase